MLLKKHFVRVILLATMLWSLLFSLVNPAYAQEAPRGVRLLVPQEKLEQVISDLSSESTKILSQNPKQAQRFSDALKSIEDAAERSDSNGYRRQLSILRRTIDGMSADEKAQILQLANSFRTPGLPDEAGCSSGCVLTNCSVDCGNGGAIPTCSCTIGLFGDCACIAAPQVN